MASGMAVGKMEEKTVIRETDDWVYTSRYSRSNDAAEWVLIPHSENMRCKKTIWFANETKKKIA
jgi:hypothetical protein